MEFSLDRETLEEHLNIDMSKIPNDHIIELDLTIERTPEELRNAYVDTLNAIGSVAGYGGAMVGGLRSTVDPLSVMGFQGRDKLYRQFPLVFILRIFYKIDGKRTQFDIAITKADVYLFAYKVGEEGEWKQCTGIDYIVKDSKFSGFDVSYDGKEDNTTSQLGFFVVGEALEGLKRGYNQSTFFHSLCIHFAEPVRFNNIREEILPHITSDYSVGFISPQARLCVNNWGDFSDAWRTSVNMKQGEVWEVPQKLRLCMPPLNQANGETESKFKKRIHQELKSWIQQNVLLLKCEKTSVRLERLEYHIPKLINVPKTTKRVAHIRNNHDLERVRNEFWERTIQGASGDLLTFGTWKTLEQIAKMLYMNNKMLSQMIIDHSDLKFSKGNILEFEDLRGEKHRLEEHLFASPSNVK